MGINKVVKTLSTRSPFKRKDTLRKSRKTETDTGEVAKVSKTERATVEGNKTDRTVGDGNKTERAKVEGNKQEAPLTDREPVSRTSSSPTYSIRESARRKFSTSSSFKQDNRKASKFDSLAIDDLSNPDHIPDLQLVQEVDEDIDDIDLDNLNTIPSLNSFPNDIDVDDIDLDNLNVGTKKESKVTNNFNDDFNSSSNALDSIFLAIPEKEPELPEFKRSPFPLSPTGRTSNATKQLTLPKNLDQTLNNFNFDFGDDDEVNEVPKKPATAMRTNTSTYQPRPSKNTHLTNYFDDLKLDFDFDNI